MDIMRDKQVLKKFSLQTTGTQHPTMLPSLNTIEQLTRGAKERTRNFFPTSAKYRKTA